MAMKQRHAAGEAKRAKRQAAALPEASLDQHGWFKVDETVEKIFEQVVCVGIRVLPSLRDFIQVLILHKLLRASHTGGDDKV